MVVAGPRCHIRDERSEPKLTRPEGHWWGIHSHQLCRQAEELIEQKQFESIQVRSVRSRRYDVPQEPQMRIGTVLLIKQSPKCT